MQQEQSSSAAIASVWYYATYCATARRPGVQMMSIVLLQPIVIVTERYTDWPCALDIFDTTRSFTHMSNTCVIRKLVFLNLGFIDLLPCTVFSAALHNLASQNSTLSPNLQISIYRERERLYNRISLLWIIMTTMFFAAPFEQWLCKGYRDSARLLGESCWQKNREATRGKNGTEMEK